jgi:hypothetical protein
VFCGWKRNARGRLIKAERVDPATGVISLAKVAMCGTKGTCGFDSDSARALESNPLTADVMPAVAVVDPISNRDIPLHVMLSSDPGGDSNSSRSVPDPVGRAADAPKIGNVRIQRGAIKGTLDTNASAVVRFAVERAALGDVLAGPFSKFTLMSTAITVMTDRDIIIDGDIGIEFDMCVTDGAAQADAARCALLLPRLQPVSSQDMASGSDNAKAEEVIGGCVKGNVCGCSCRFVSPHLTSFAVVDRDLAFSGEVTPDALDAGVESLSGAPSAFPSAPGSEPDTTSEVAGPEVSSSATATVIGVCAAAVGAVAAVAAVVVRRRARARMPFVTMTTETGMRASDFKEQSISNTISVGDTTMLSNPMHAHGAVTSAGEKLGSMGVAGAPEGGVPSVPPAPHGALSPASERLKARARLFYSEQAVSIHSNARMTETQI